MPLLLIHFPSTKSTYLKLTTPLTVPVLHGLHSPLLIPSATHPPFPLQHLFRMEILSPINYQEVGQFRVPQSAGKFTGSLCKARIKSCKPESHIHKHM